MVSVLKHSGAARLRVTSLFRIASDHFGKLGCLIAFGIWDLGRGAANLGLPILAVGMGLRPTNRDENRFESRLHLIK